jgi:hypothetical protein
MKCLNCSKEAEPNSNYCATHRPDFPRRIYKILGVIGILGVITSIYSFYLWHWGNRILPSLEFYSSSQLWPILIPLLILNFFVGRKASPDPGLLVEGGKYNRPLQALEKEPEAKEQLFKHWDETTRRQLRSALYWDFLFILLYPTSNALACFMAGRFLAAQGVRFRISLVIILLQPLAGLFDVLENLILLKVINGLTAKVWLTIARISTAGKFTLIAPGIILPIVGLLAWVCLTCLSHQ